ncbi:hypothetical protein PRIC1_009874 [Phytophthora ramorum]
MRLSYVLLVATATTLLASGNALSAATNADQTADISAMGSPDLVTSLEIGNGDGDEKRFLRSHRAEEDDDDSNEGEDDEDENENEEEERAGGANLFTTSKLNEMLSGVKTFDRFARWKRDGWIPTAIFNKFGTKSKYKELASMYNRNYDTIRVKPVNAGR